MDEADLSIAPARIVIRHYNHSEDQAIIYATWRNSSFYGGSVRRKDTDEYFRLKTAEIKEILKSASVRIACLEDDPKFIIGYAVYTDDHLNWVYVKVDYRGKGIGTILMPKGINSVTSDVTKIGKIIALKKNLNLKENSHGRNSNREKDKAEESSAAH